jgi:hypothetical protein
MLTVGTGGYSPPTGSGLDYCFKYALFGQDKIDLQGIVDFYSYDSSKGIYSSRVAALSKGYDIATNNTVNKSIYLEGIMDVPGKALCGVGGNPNTAIRTLGIVDISGGTAALAEEEKVPDIQIPSGLPIKTHNGTYSGILPNIEFEPGDYRGSGTLTLNGIANMTLKGPGIFVFDSMKIIGITQLRADSTNGPVHVIIDGDYVIDGISSGGIQVYHGMRNSVPADCTVFCTDKCKNIKIEGIVSQYYSLYAPSAIIQVTAILDLVGSTLAKQITFNGIIDHYYDVQLKNGTAGTGGLTVKSWQVF